MIAFDLVSRLYFSNYGDYSKWRSPLNIQSTERCKLQVFRLKKLSIFAVAHWRCLYKIIIHSRRRKLHKMKRAFTCRLTWMVSRSVGRLSLLVSRFIKSIKIKLKTATRIKCSTSKSKISASQAQASGSVCRIIIDSHTFFFSRSRHRSRTYS